MGRVFSAKIQAMPNGRASTAVDTSTANDPRHARGIVRVYAYYRFLLTIVILGMYLAGFAASILGTFSGELFLLTASGYLAITTISLIWLLSRRFNYSPYLPFLYLLLDVVALNLLAFASGGISSGLGLLQLVTVATGSLIYTGQLPIFLAAIASILIMGETALGVLIFGAKDADFFQSGLLGAVLFFTALLFRLLNRRLQASQTLAIREADQAAHLQRLNELIVNRMRTGIILIDTNSQVRLINNAATELLGASVSGNRVAIGHSLRAAPELFKQFQNWEKYPWLRCPPIAIPATNSEIQCNFARLDEAEEKHTIIFIEDTRSIAQNAQQLKLASLGRLAGSIAHEIRNPLGAISHASQMLEEHSSGNNDVAALTTIIERHSNRVNNIVDSILQLSRQEAPKFQKLRLDIWLEHFIHEYQAIHGGNCAIECEVHRADLQVLFDPTHLTQVVTNLVDNALRHGKQASGDAWVKLRAHQDNPSALPCLDFHDSGPGIDKAHLNQIFEPFFTTSHEGTGLGLYLAKERCEFNYSTLSYCLDTTDAGRLSPKIVSTGESRDDDGVSSTRKGFFRIMFAHPDHLLPPSPSP